MWVFFTTQGGQFYVDPEYICITKLSIGERNTSPIFVVTNSAIREGDGALRRPDAYFDQLRGYGEEVSDD